MKWKRWLENWNMTSLKVKTPFLESEWKPQDEDKSAAWDLYVELLTRVTTQPLPDDIGDEKTALESIHSLFGLTRKIIKENGRHCIEFTKIAILILNQVVRPFSRKWHSLLITGAFEDMERCKEFRTELATVQFNLQKYTKMLADMADVEDLTELEDG
jgi:hypothetical protein